MRALKYSIEEAVASLWRGRRSGVLSVVTIAAALFVLGVLLVVTWNIQGVLAQWAEAAEMSVYLRDGVSAEGRAAIDQLLAESDLVAGREYVSKGDALVKFKRDFADLSSMAGDLSDNPFPASFEVHLQSVTQDAAAIERLAMRLGDNVGVADVRYDRRWLERVMTAVVLVRSVGIFVVLVLITAAALTVANVVRLACHTRREEIEIMQLVGAPITYVRGPFVAEGTLQGGAGALVALGGLWIGFLVGRLRYGELTADLLGVEAVSFLPWSWSLLVVLGGMAVGCAAGLVAARSTREGSPSH